MTTIPTTWFVVAVFLIMALIGLVVIVFFFVLPFLWRMSTPYAKRQSLLARARSQNARADLIEQQLTANTPTVKARVDGLRADRLERDLNVVEARAQAVANQSTLTELRIEEKRRELGARAEDLDQGRPSWDGG